MKQTSTDLSFTAFWLITLCFLGGIYLNAVAHAEPIPIQRTFGMCRLNYSINGHKFIYPTMVHVLKVERHIVWFSLDRENQSPVFIYKIAKSKCRIFGRAQ